MLANRVVQNTPAGESVSHQVADIAQIVAGFASVVAIISVWLLWRQIKQEEKTSEDELIAGMTTLITTVGAAFIEHPEMRQYFYAKRRPKRRHYQRAHAIAVALVGALDHVAAHLDEMDVPVRNAWKQYFTDVYDNSPVVRDHLQAHWQWYGPKLCEHYNLGPRASHDA